MTDNIHHIYLNGEYSKRNPDYHVEDSAWKAQQILSMLKKHNVQASSVCEVGCGAGEVLVQLKAHFPEHTVFHGFEISPQAFELCKQRENDCVQFFCRDLLETETPPYDLLLCLDVFEHLVDYLGFLRHLRKKANYKLFHIPLDISVQTVLRGTPILRARARVGHLHYFTKETALLTLRDTSYQVLDWLYTPARVDNPRTIQAKLAKLPRKILSLISSDLTVRILGGYSLLVLAK